MSHSDVFAQGISSGDPYQDSVVIWTRVSDEDLGVRDVEVNWEVSRKPAFKRKQIVDQGRYETSADRDWTVKVLAENLQPGQDYYYRFKFDEATSDVGHTRTLPDEADAIRLGVFSCANFTAMEGFVAYGRAAEIDAQDPFDALLHLGDYIYEYGEGGYPEAEDAVSSRGFEPDGELLTLDDYRARYAQYHSDENLRNLLASAPLIAIWDDHEVANDSWAGGAQNHQPDTEGDWETRRDQALKAYYEWMPIREPEWREGSDAGTALTPLTQAYRSFDFADLASIHLLETRLSGRDLQLAWASTGYPTPEQVQTRIATILGDFELTTVYAELLSLELPSDEASMAAFAQSLIVPVGAELAGEILATSFTDTERQILGEQQMGWLQQELATSPSVWQVLSSGTTFRNMSIPVSAAQLVGNIDFDNPPLDVLNALGAPIQKLVSGVPFDELLQEEQALFAPENKVPFNLDAWDGYGAQRELILQTAQQLGQKTVVLSGDIHNGWAGTLNTFTESSDGSSPAGSTVGVEFTGPGVTSPGIEKYFPGIDAYYRQAFPGVDGLDDFFTSYVDGLAYADINRRGFMEVTFGRDVITTNYHLIDPATSPIDASDWVVETVQADTNFDLFPLSPQDETTSRVPARYRNQARSVFLAGAGDDLIQSGSRRSFVSAGGGNDQILGGSSKELLLGDQGDDLIRGKGGRDELRGGKGADELNGGRGDDVLHGGSGSDRFRISYGDDRILDLNPSQGDVLLLPKQLEVALSETADGVLLTSDRGATMIEGLTLEQVEGLI